MRARVLSGRLAAGSQFGPSQPAASFLHHHRRTNSVTAAHGHADSNCNPHADSNRHSHGDTHGDAHTVADPDGHSDTNGYRAGLVDNVRLNVRSGPGLEFPVILTVAPDYQFTILATSADGGWLNVCCTADGSDGWVSALYILENALPVTP